LKIPKGKLEASNHRMTHNTMAKGKGTNGRTMKYNSKRDKNKGDIMHVVLLIE